MQRCRIHARLVRSVGPLEPKPERQLAEDDLVVDEGNVFFHLGRREQVRLDAPRRRRGHSPLEFVHALLGAGDFDTAGVDRQVHVPVLVGALFAEQGHLFVVIHREDEVRGVAGRAAGVGQRTLVEKDHVGPPEPSEVADETVADDPGADHDDVGLLWHGVGG